MHSTVAMPAPFPLAEPIELIPEACAEFGCALTVHDIKNPTPAKVQQVYEAWMLKLLEINLEDCMKAAKDQLDQMDNYVGLQSPAAGLQDRIWKRVFGASSRG